MTKRLATANTECATLTTMLYVTEEQKEKVTRGKELTKRDLELANKAKEQKERHMLLYRVKKTGSIGET